MGIKRLKRFYAALRLRLLTNLKFVVRCVLSHTTTMVILITYLRKLLLLQNKRYTIIFVSLLCSYLSTTYAANERPFERIADLGEELLEEQAKQRESYEAQVSPQNIVCGEEQPQLSEQDTQAFIDVSTIEISGTQLLTEEEQACLVNSYAGRRVSLAELKVLATDIDCYLMDKGYLTTRAYIPKQTFEGGKVIIEVIEGIVECIDLPCSKKWTAFPWVEGRLLKTNDLEQGMEQINRLSSENAIMMLWPGENLGGEHCTHSGKNLEPLPTLHRYR